MSNRQRTVTIIIPTYNRASSIGITIESLLKQTYPKELLEIIIADNNSTDNTKEVIKSWQSRSDIPIVYLDEPRQGAHFARNSAAKLAKGEILYFTDDDMIADKDLLTNLLKVFDMNFNVAVAGGKVLPKWEFDPPDWLVKYFKNGSLSLIEKNEKLIIADYDIGIYSCHQAMLKEVLFKCGGFNPDIVKEKLIGNGETGLNIKILGAGYNFAYVNDAVSYHIIPRSRMTQKYINYRFGNQGNCDGFTGFRKNSTSKKELLKLVCFSHIPSMFNYFFKSLIPRGEKGSWRLQRAYYHYFLQRAQFDLKLVFDDKWRLYALKYDYFTD